MIDFAFRSLELEEKERENRIVRRGARLWATKLALLSQLAGAARFGKEA
jgi:hypothetical protein